MKSNSMFKRCFAIFVFLIAVVDSASATTRKRLALIIGNSEYQYATGLSNPVNDAELIESVLSRHGVKTILRTNLNLLQFKRELSDFLVQLSKLGPKAEALFFYAGHGIQFDGRNFLIPVDANVKSRADIPLYSMELSNLVAALRKAGSKSSFVIIDACRNNPFRGLFRGSQGLKVEGAPPGFLISFSTSPDNVAQDGTTGNSPFAAALAKYIQKPGMPIETVLKRVRYSVWKETNGAQIPWENTSLFDDFILVPSTTGKENEMAAPAEVATRVSKQTILLTVGSTGKRLVLVPGVGKNSYFKDCADCPVMAVIPSGSFQMGDRSIKAARPVHEVRIPRPYAISRFEISFKQIISCEDCTFSLEDEGWGKDRLPAINLSMKEVKTYLGWLSKKAKRVYRLPSEAEWEYAALAGRSNKYWTGGKINKNQANLKFVSSSLYRTVPTDTGPFNAWGLAHIHGNVSEWVADCWHPNYQEKPISLQSNGAAWSGSGCYSKVIKGGSWNTSPEKGTARVRQWRALTDLSPDVGFRVLREIKR